jgi:hypothetical protein
VNVNIHSPPPQKNMIKPQLFRPRSRFGDLPAIEKAYLTLRQLESLCSADPWFRQRLGEMGYQAVEQALDACRDDMRQMQTMRYFCGEWIPNRVFTDDEVDF